MLIVLTITSILSIISLTSIVSRLIIALIVFIKNQNLMLETLNLNTGSHVIIQIAKTI